MLARTLALLVAALAAGGASAQSAFAGTVDVTPEIYGAGTITGTGDPEVVSCTQAAPVGGAAHKACTNWTVSKGAAVAGGFSLGSDEAGVTFRCRIDGRSYGPCDADTPLAPGRHTVEAFATDEAGNADATPARLEWTVPEPPPALAPPAAPAPAAPEPAAPATGPAVSAPIATVAKPRSFSLRYRYARGRLTRLQAVGLPAGTKLAVTVSCPKKRGCPKSPTMLKRLVGKRLARGTRITVRAGATTRTITIPRRS
jgi:hypothetical protein